MLSDITIIIKTFERSSCIKRLLKSIRKYYPDIPVVVADDSQNPPDLSSYQVEHVKLPFNSGISLGRNKALEKVRTAYFLLLDDDHTFTKKTGLEKMLLLLKDNDLDIIAGKMVQYGIPRHFEFIFKREDDILYLVDKYKEKLKDGIFLYDIVLNFYLASKVKILEMGAWDEDFRIEGHTDFFLRAQNHRLRTGYCPDISTNHFPKRYKGYTSYRWNQDFKRLYNKKHGISQIVISRKHPCKILKLMIIVWDYFFRQIL